MGARFAATLARQALAARTVWPALAAARLTFALATLLAA